MPISKRSKIVHLSKTKKIKTGKRSAAIEAKNILINTIRQMIEQKNVHIYIIQLNNQKNSLLKEARDKFKPGRLFYGKNKVIQIALGTQPSTECIDNIYKLSKLLRGERGLLITNKGIKEINNIIKEIKGEEYAKAGFKATKTIILEPGFEALERFPHSMEQRLRSLGLPTQLQNGRINLLGRFTVCTEGMPISVEQAQILKHLEVKMAEFSLTVVAHWHEGAVEVF